MSTDQRTLGLKPGLVRCLVRAPVQVQARELPALLLHRRYWANRILTLQYLQRWRAQAQLTGRSAWLAPLLLMRLLRRPTLLLPQLLMQLPTQLLTLPVRLLRRRRRL